MHAADDRPVNNIPVVKAGYRNDLKTVLNTLGIASRTPARDSTEAEWVGAESTIKPLPCVSADCLTPLTPSVVGMGLKDATYLVENKGLKVSTRGYGRVVSRSVTPGKPY